MPRHIHDYVMGHEGTDQREYYVDVPDGTALLSVNCYGYRTRFTLSVDQPVYSTDDELIKIKLSVVESLQEVKPEYGKYLGTFLGMDMKYKHVYYSVLGKKIEVETKELLKKMKESEDEPTGV